MSFSFFCNRNAQSFSANELTNSSCFWWNWDGYHKPLSQADNYHKKSLYFLHRKVSARWKWYIFSTSGKTKTTSTWTQNLAFVAKKNWSALALRHRKSFYNKKSELNKNFKSHKNNFGGIFLQERMVSACCLLCHWA